MWLYADRTLWPDAPPARAVLFAPTCEACQVHGSVENFVTDEGYKRITAGFVLARRPVPPRETIALEWAPIDSPEVQTFRRVVAQSGN